MISLSLLGPQRPSQDFLCPSQICLSLPQSGRLPAQVVPPSAVQAAFYLSLSLTGFNTLPASKIIQTSPILLRQKRAPPHPCCYKAYLPQPFLPHCISKCNLCVALHGMWCPLPTGCAYMWLINYWQSHLPNGGCPVFSQLMLFRLLAPSCISGMNRNDQNRNKLIYARATIECL